MADKERDKDKKILPPKVPRPNYQMWVILALTAVILGITFFKNARGLVDIQTSTFEAMVASNDVKRVRLCRSPSSRKLCKTQNTGWNWKRTGPSVLAKAALITSVKSEARRFLKTG